MIILEKRDLWQKIRNFSTKHRVKSRAGSILIVFLLLFGTSYSIKFYKLRHNVFELSFNNSPVEKMLYYYTLCREFEYNPPDHLNYYSKLILHCTNKTNLFNKVEEMISEQGTWEWLYGDSMNESWNVLDNYFGVPGWGYNNYPASNFFEYIKENVDPSEDDDIANLMIGDFIQSSIETLVRGKGDCEDFAILGASTHVSAGYETMVAIFHDNNVNITATDDFYKNFNHAFYFIKMNDTGEYSSGNYWSFKDSNTTWLLVDIMWCPSFGSQPTWISAYPERTSRYFEDWNDTMNVKEVLSLIQ